MGCVEWNGPDVRVHPGGALQGSMRPPGSKSLTNRYLICAALADGRSVLSHASLSDDTLALVRGLQALGVQVSVSEQTERIVVAGARGSLPAPEADINIGHAGTAMRFLTALACLGYGEFRISGSARMRERPIGSLVDALRTLGALVGYEDAEGFPPVEVRGQGLPGGEVTFDDLVSSQFVSAILMVAPYARQDVMIRIRGELPSEPYLAMTIAAMRSLGVELVESEGRRFVVPALQRYQGREVEIEPDATGATYLWAGAAITGGRIQVQGLTRESHQGDTRFADVLAQMGCVVEESEAGITVAAPPSGKLKGIAIDLNDMPDTAQTLAVVALFAEGPTEIRNVGTLRVKETDRIAALAMELDRLGAQVVTSEAGLAIEPPAQLTPATIETYDDHRMALSFALAGLVDEGVTIRNAECVSKSYPGYFGVLDELTSG